MIDGLLGCVRDHPYLWEILVGASLCDRGWNPSKILLFPDTWDWDWIQEDKNLGRLARLPIPTGTEGDMVRKIAGYILEGNEYICALPLSSRTRT